MSSSKTLNTLKYLLSHTSLATDTLILRFLRLLSTPNGTSSLLTTLQYTLTLLHSQLTRVLTARYERLAISIANKASQTMLPGEALVATIQAPHLTLTSYCAATDAARRTVEDVRMFGRLVGLARIYARGRELFWEGRRDPAVKVLEWGRIAAEVGFQVCENGAFLVRRGVLRGEKWEARGERWWVWSWRFWAAQMSFEALRLWRVRQMRYDEDLGAQGVSVQSKELEKRWWRDAYEMLGWAPATILFGFYDEETSPISEGWVGVGGMMSGLVVLREAWKNTA